MAPAMSWDLPLGFRFAPTDEELLWCLDYKNRGLAEKHNVFITEVDICKSEPRDLTQKNLLTGKDGELYFFSKRTMKYRNSENIIDRTTGEGYWKNERSDPDIKTSDERLIGTRKSFSFIKGSSSHRLPTEWRMEEYILGRKGGSASLQDAYGLYRVFKSNKVRKNADQSTLNPKADHNEPSIKPLEVLSGEQTHSSPENNYLHEFSYPPPSELVADDPLPDTNDSNGQHFLQDCFMSPISESCDYLNESSYSDPYHILGHNNEMCSLPMWETEKFYFP